MTRPLKIGVATGAAALAFVAANVGYYHHKMNRQGEQVRKLTRQGMMGAPQATASAPAPDTGDIRVMKLCGARPLVPPWWDYCRHYDDFGSWQRADPRPPDTWLPTPPAGQVYLVSWVEVGGSLWLPHVSACGVLKGKLATMPASGSTVKTYRPAGDCVESGIGKGLSPAAEAAVQAYLDAWAATCASNGVKARGW